MAILGICILICVIIYEKHERKTIYPKRKKEYDEHLKELLGEDGYNLIKGNTKK